MNKSAARFMVLLGLMHGVDAFHCARAGRFGVAPRAVQALGASRSKENVVNFRHIHRPSLMMSARSTVGPNEELNLNTGNFAVAFAQSLILASATSLVTYEALNLKQPSSEIYTTSQSLSPSQQSSNFERSYEVRCITDGFEFSQEGGVKSEISRSYRQCEALGRSAIGVI